MVALCFATPYAPAAAAMHPSQIAAVSCSGTPRQAYIYDVTSHLRVATLDESGSIAGSPSPIRAERSSRGVLSTAWGPSDDLLLWGSTLWDLRMPKVTGGVLQARRPYGLGRRRGRYRGQVPCCSVPAFRRCWPHSRAPEVRMEP